MSSFDLFRSKQLKNEQCIDKYEGSFIVEGTGSVIIHHVRLDVDKEAALIITEKEGPDTGIVYTYKQQVADNELLKGDYFTWNGLRYFVFEDVVLTRDVIYKKQRWYECNCSFTIDNNTYYGYYVASLAKYIDTTLKSNLVITDNDKPILILPIFDEVEVGLRIIVNGKPYKIIDFDAITNDGIVYCSLDRDFAYNAEDVAEPVIIGALTAGIENVMDIHYGYFKTNVAVDVVNKTLTQVKFIIPQGYDSITITTKDASKRDVVTTYRVVI